MNLRTATSLLLGAALFGTLPSTAVVAQNNDPIIVAGSGTTNPSKCFWHIMAKLEEQIKLPARLTYRAVGSGTGQKEFLGKGIDVNGTSTNTLIPYNNFGAGDIPISREDWIEFGGGGEGKGASFVQLPFVLSAVGFFHSVPGVPTGERGLNLTACLLSRIFQADITTWDHPDILAENPNLNVAENYPIFVGRRVKGSSSTYSITHYLYQQCPQTDENPQGWPLDKRSKEIEWPASTYPCDGSGLMSRCLQENEGAIGYVDVAHGHEELLPEIRVKNGDGFFLTSKEAGDEGIQDAAKDLSKVPSSADGDFSDVAYYNEPGPNTWPIALVSYIYIRKDISFIKNPASRTLLKAFARSLYDPLYIGLCSRFGHIPVPTDVRNLALAGIDMVNEGQDLDQEWTFETEDTIPGWGQGDRVISARRQNFVLYEGDSLRDDVDPLKEELRQLKLDLASVRAQTLGASSGGAAVKAAWAAGASVAAAALLGLF